MNSRLDLVRANPFERLRSLLADLYAPNNLAPINLGVGEPQHPTPEIVKCAIAENLHLLGKYPTTQGTPALREAISLWLSRRYAVPAPDPETSVIPVSGSREALFAFAQTVIDPAERAAVLLPNPFYQIYEGAALLAGAEPIYIPTPAENGYLPDWSAAPATVWPRVRLAYVCSPGNPAGAVLGENDWHEIISLADRYGFVVVADECYSEIYADEPPTGILQVAHRLGRGNERLVTINSLSKRSSAPGLRSGFVAGDPALIAKFMLYRNYHGAAPSLLVQAASVAAWSDERHVEENRTKYGEKFRAALEILPDARIPKGGFFLWLSCADDEMLTRRLFEKEGLTVLPGTYLARAINGYNPGAKHLRIALVPEVELCRDALIRLRTVVEELDD